MSLNASSSFLFVGTNRQHFMFWQDKKTNTAPQSIWWSRFNRQCFCFLHSRIYCNHISPNRQCQTFTEVSADARCRDTAWGILFWITDWCECAALTTQGHDSSFEHVFHALLNTSKKLWVRVFLSLDKNLTRRILVTAEILTALICFLPFGTFHY